MSIIFSKKKKLLPSKQGFEYVHQKEIAFFSYSLSAFDISKPLKLKYKGCSFEMHNKLIFRLLTKIQIN